MKLVRTANKRFTFSLSKLEKHIFGQVLQLYPLVPPAHHTLQQAARGPAADDAQRLLDEALAEHRQENRRRVQALLQEPGRFREGKNRVRLALTAAEIDWLLQVLNDVRVGAWLGLGEPGELDEPLITADTAPHFFALQAVDGFQSVLLDALGIHEPFPFGEA